MGQRLIGSEATWARGRLGQRPSGPEGTIGPEVTWAEAYWARGQLGQRPIRPEATWARGLWGQRPSVPEADEARGHLGQRPKIEPEAIWPADDWATSHLGRRLIKPEAR